MSTSHWGWGLAERFPDREARRAVAAQVSALLGATPQEPEEPTSIEQADVPAARLEAPTTLAVPVSTDREARLRHTYGRAYPDVVRGFRGDFSLAPDAVASPRSEAEVVEALAWADRVGARVVPFGGGTSVVGGVTCPRADTPVVSLDLRGLDRVLEIDPISRSARIEAGVLGPRLEAALATSGLTLRHFPQSFPFSTLGGWLATRAGGHYATGYTHIDDLTQAIRATTGDGRVWESARVPASGAGPAPDRLLLGSEGTLAVITSAWMRVQRRPTSRVSTSVHFAEWRAAVDATREIAQAWLSPTNCRLLDAREAQQNGVSFDDASVLVLAFESVDEPRDAWMERALAICARHGGVAPAGVQRRGAAQSGEAGAAVDAGERWRSAFVDAPYLQNVLVSVGVVADTFETACTWDRFDALHAQVIADVREAMRRVAGRGRISCRFTHVYPDGPAPYYTFFCPAARGRELEQWGEIKRAAGDALAKVGATITHHHAVGRTHRPWYDRERPAPFADALRAAKRALDPRGRLNPGVLFDP
jgi:alkyldihydroxyacetonephosphate synthase